MNRLILFSNSFPYGEGEKTFILPEIKYLSRYYDISIVSGAGPAAKSASDLASPLPTNVNVLSLDRGSRLKKVLKAFKAPFDPIAREEIAEIIASRTNILRRIFESLYIYASARCIQEFCRRNGFFDNCQNTILYTYWLADYSLAIALEKQRNPHIRFISRTHGYDLYNERNSNGRQPFQGILARNCNRLIFAAKRPRLYFEQSYIPPLNNRHYEVVHIGAAAPPFFGLSSGAPEDSTSFIVVSCSSLIPLKRVRIIAEALKILDNPHIRWVHFGDGPERPALEAYTTEHCLNASFEGHVALDTIQTFYSAAPVGVFVTASETEGCPVSITEALAYGIPIIGTDVGGIPEQIDGNGVLLPKDLTATDMAHAISHIYSMTQKERKRLGDKSLKIWRDDFDQEKCLRKLMRILDSV